MGWRMGIGLSGCMLLGTLILAWCWRYEAVNDAKHWSLSDMQALAGDRDQVQWFGEGEGRGLRIDKGPADPMRTLVLELPDCGPVNALHLEYRIKAVHLVAGDTSWSQGRLALQWLGEGNQAGGENDPVHDFSGNRVIEVRSRVVAPARAQAVPRILIQNIARSGGLEVEKLEVSVVHQRPVWPWLAGCLGMAGWIWFAVLFRMNSKAGLIPVLGAALLCVGVCVVLILPKSADFKPQLFGMVYQLGKPPAENPVTTTAPPDQPRVTPNPVAPPPTVAEPNVPTQTGISSTTPAQDPAPAPPSAPYSLGTMKPKPGIVSWIQMRLHKFKVAVHVMAFLIPTLLIAWWVGIHQAARISGIFAVASEASQWFFGDVWNLRDGIDLLVNVAAVGLGLGLAVAVKRKFER